MPCLRAHEGVPVWQAQLPPTALPPQEALAAGLCPEHVGRGCRQVPSRALYSRTGLEPQGRPAAPASAARGAAAPALFPDVKQGELKAPKFKFVRKPQKSSVCKDTEIVSLRRGAGLTAPRPQRMIAEAHRRAVQEYLRVMQKRILLPRRRGAQGRRRAHGKHRLSSCVPLPQLASVSSARPLPAGTGLGWGGGRGRMLSVPVRQRLGLPRYPFLSPLLGSKS